jgi:hypothetical protein
VVEGARLESVYTLTTYRGFESLPLRQVIKGLRSKPFLINLYTEKFRLLVALAFSQTAPGEFKQEEDTGDSTDDFEKQHFIVISNL